ncbi:hypothetical protein [Nostoc sp.]|uniref:hypothetical protein n=1 Tax=Nostoc sp. TaxID=1180 RepID=UPI002FF59378
MCFFLVHTALPSSLVYSTTQSLLKSTIFIPIFSDRKQRSRYSDTTHFLRSHFITIRSAAPSRTAYHIPAGRREQLPADILPLDAGRSFIILVI